MARGNRRVQRRSSGLCRPRRWLRRCRPRRWLRPCRPRLLHRLLDPRRLDLHQRYRRGALQSRQTGRSRQTGAGQRRAAQPAGQRRAAQQSRTGVVLTPCEPRSHGGGPVYPPPRVGPSTGVPVVGLLRVAPGPGSAPRAPSPAGGWAQGGPNSGSGVWGERDPPRVEMELGGGRIVLLIRPG